LRQGSAGWEATNTDVAGFLAPLDAAVAGSLDGQRASVLGAGGSARAVVAGLRKQGLRVTVHARRAVQARELAASLGCGVGPWPPAAGSWDVLVNTTPLGGANRRDHSPLPGGPFGGRLVYDLTYGAGDSALLAEARKAGCQVLDGLPMLVAQAERQFEWWTGRRPRAGLMESAAREALAQAKE
jgi:shikimate 5-dehydrogenase